MGMLEEPHSKLPDGITNSFLVKVNLMRFLKLRLMHLFWLLN